MKLFKRKCWYHYDNGKGELNFIKCWFEKYIIVEKQTYAVIVGKTGVPFVADLKHITFDKKAVIRNHKK